MTIRPVDLNGMIQRTNDVSTIKQQEDSKPIIDQQNIQSGIQKSQERKMKEIVHANDSEEPEYRYDAKEKGNGEYQGKNKKRKKQQDGEDESGQVKKKGISKGFDIRI